jgi:hypothetical protein
MKAKKIYMIIFFSLILMQTVKAQHEDTLYTIDAYAGAGYGYYVTDMDIEGLSRGGVNLSLRVMWQPEHLLSVGLNTGYLQFYTFELKDAVTSSGKTDISADLTAIPIGILFSMRIIEGLNITAGTSLYILNSHADSHGNNVVGTDLSTGSLISLTYTKPVSGNLALGGELKYNFVNKIKDGSLSLSAVLKYTLLEY